MLVDVMDGGEVIWTYNLPQWKNPFDAEAFAAHKANGEGLSFTHVRARWESGETQTTLFD